MAEIFGSGSFGIGFAERAGDRVVFLVAFFRALEVPALAALVTTFDFVAIEAGHPVRGLNDMLPWEVTLRSVREPRGVTRDRRP